MPHRPLPGWVLALPFLFLASTLQAEHGLTCPSSNQDYTYLTDLAAPLTVQQILEHVAKHFPARCVKAVVLFGSGRHYLLDPQGALLRVDPQYDNMPPTDAKIGGKLPAGAPAQGLQKWKGETSYKDLDLFIEPTDKQCLADLERERYFKPDGSHPGRLVHPRTGQKVTMDLYFRPMLPEVAKERSFVVLAGEPTDPVRERAVYFRRLGELGLL
ncbi:MAG: hypothetical protein A2284_18075 [Deltaproteobacteria bacterium RIFOXYA12_FULL_61_11]|nr:MAG: hypothetical protein A2284_18075 [Deltaproteobacteria bacterium RIFOXYA12_FULL_61_11]